MKFFSNIEIEEHLLAVALKLSGDCQRKLFDVVKDTYFEDPVIQKHFIAARKAYEQDGFVDIVSLPDKLREKTWYMGIEKIIEVYDNIGSVYNWPYWADELERAYTKRQLHRIGVQFLEQIETSSPEESMHFLQQASASLEFACDLKTVTDIIEEDLNNPPPERVFLTGVRQLDKHSKFAYQHLCILAGRPSTGKTTLMMNMVTNIPEDKKVLVFSMEQPRHEIIDIMAAIQCKVSINDSTYRRKQYWIEMKRDRSFENVHIDDQTNKLEKIEMQILKTKPDVVFVDNLQGFDLTGKGSQNRTYALQDICRSLKFMAKQYKCCIVLLVQLGRESQIDDKEPETYHIKDSGGVEQEADLIIGIWEKKASQQTMLKILKYRQGQKDIAFEVDYMKAFGKFI